jgi:predicted CXXCH cytochrome family protein
VTLWPLQGEANVGTDLSDDHPISFVYDRALALQQGNLMDPSTLPPDVPLDASSQVQCTTCHDPHKDKGGQFLRVIGVPESCVSCHGIHNDERSWHYTCSWCHDMHGAAGPQRLLIAPDVVTLCGTCHLYYGSTVAVQRSVTSPAATMATTTAEVSSLSTAASVPHLAAKNLSADFSKASIHPVRSFSNEHQPEEDPRTMPRHVTCTDCHDAHPSSLPTRSPLLSSSRNQISHGINLAGSAVIEVRYEYERCFKCHGVRDQTVSGITRQDNTRNVRLEIDPGNLSYHPVAAIGKDSAMQGFESGYGASSLITCTDCHNSDEAVTSVIAAKGPHGSRFAPILEREYQQGDPVVDAFQSYALCYKCHTRSTLMSSGRFPHRVHVQEQQASCAVCHDAHGSRTNSGLINFMVRDQVGKKVVSPNRQGVMQFLSTTPDHGECTLSCHGAEHDRQRY